MQSGISGVVNSTSPCVRGESDKVRLQSLWAIIFYSSTADSSLERSVSQEDFMNAWNYI